MLFGSVELNAQFFTLLIAFLALLLPLGWNFLTRKDKQKELEQRSIELLLEIDDKNKTSEFAYIYAKNHCLRTITGYKASVDFFKELDKFDDPVRALETYRAYPLRFEAFPERPKTNSRFVAVITFVAFTIISAVLLPFMSQLTIDTYSNLTSRLAGKENSQEKGLEGKITITSKSEWEIDSTGSTFNLKNKPVFVVNKAKGQIGETSEGEDKNDSNFLTSGFKFLEVSMLFLMLVMTFFAQMFLLVMMFGSFIKALNYFSEGRQKFETAITLKPGFKYKEITEQKVQKELSKFAKFTIWLYVSVKSIIDMYIKK